MISLWSATSLLCYAPKSETDFSKISVQILRSQRFLGLMFLLNVKLSFHLQQLCLHSHTPLESQDQVKVDVISAAKREIFCYSSGRSCSSSLAATLANVIFCSLPPHPPLPLACFLMPALPFRDSSSLCVQDDGAISLEEKMGLPGSTAFLSSKVGA